jgi:hypothetical protein
MNTAVTSLPLGVAAPVSASADAGPGRWLARASAAVWRALEVVGRARARSELLAYADRCEDLQPDLARELRAACRQGPMT